MDYKSMDIKTLKDLTKLPWFEDDGNGKIRVKDGTDIPPIYDDHSHLGWSYFFGGVIDHLKAPLPIKYFYDFDTPQDMFEEHLHPLKSEANMMTVDIAFIIFRCPPIARTQTVPNLLEEMDRCKVSAIALMPIEIPLRSRHARQTVAAAKSDRRLISFAGVHPQTPSYEKRIRDQVADGAKGFKYHPEFQFAGPDGARAMSMFETCEKMGLPVLCHSGSTGTEPKFMQKLSALHRFKIIFDAFPNLKFILGHAGLKDTESAIEYSKKYPQVYLDLAGQTVPQITQLLTEADHDRIMYGSDWPFFPMPVTIARTMIALDKFPQAREKVMGGNLKKLLKLDF